MTWWPWLLLLCGCGPHWTEPTSLDYSDPEQWTVCVDLPAARQADAFKGVMAWSTALERWRFLKPVSGSSGACSVWIHETDTGGGESPAMGAWVSQIGAREVNMVRGRYEPYTLPVTLHELGHVLGAQHVAWTTMSKAQDLKAVCPDQMSVVQVAAWNHIDPGLLRWCYF